MKVCPTCRRTYTDEALNFCLEDGSVLTIARNDLPETVMMNQPRFTEPNPAVPQSGVRTSYGDQAAYSMQPKKSSKTWLWVLGILGVLVLTCGGGFAAFVVYVASISPDPGQAPTPVPVRGNTTPSPTPFPRNELQALDLEKWVNKDSKFGNTSFSGDEFFMSSKNKGFYYVVAATEGYKTERASTSVKLRNVSGQATDLGYGLVFHSDPKPLQKGYALVIDTVRQRYRVVRHEPGKEVDVVDWTSSTAIKAGTVENTLEVRDTPERVELYINGILVNNIKNSHGYRGGVVGLYTGDAINIGFKNLEISK